jgi:hypothetical protein
MYMIVTDSQIALKKIKYKRITTVILKGNIPKKALNKR